MISLIIALFILSFIVFIGVLMKEDVVKTANKNRFRNTRINKNAPADEGLKATKVWSWQENESGKNYPKELTSTKQIQWDKAFLNKIEWKLFEDICMEYLRIKHCDANVTCSGADGGIDITIKDNQDRIIAFAQCKSWSKPIGVSHIRELFGVMASERVKVGVFLTTSFFSKEAKQFAIDKPLVLIDGDELIRLINLLSPEQRERIEKLINKGDFSTPTCVHCNVKLIQRTTKSGPNAGRVFWGCVNYPRCKVTMHISKKAA
ncbi:MAG: restriction endonuclease [Methylococcaceae bacterium]|nr:restriction endonuclease [Methylococcaceae bacterium]